MFPALLSSMLSLSRHLKAPDQCVIHVIVSRADMDSALRLAACFQVEADDISSIPEVKLHEMRYVPFNLADFKDTWEDLWPTGAPLLTSHSFVPLYLPDYLPEAARAIWLSSDTIVKVDIGQLYRMSMHHIVAAALDARSVTWRSEYMKQLDKIDTKLLDEMDDIDTRTFSSDIMVLDLERWRSEALTQKLETWILRTHGVRTAKLALNLEFRDRFDLLDWRWHVNGLVMKPPRSCIEEAWVLHWSGDVSPWGPWSSMDLLPHVRELYDEVVRHSLPNITCTFQQDVSMLDSDIDVIVPTQ